MVQRRLESFDAEAPITVYVPSHIAVSGPASTIGESIKVMVKLSLTVPIHGLSASASKVSKTEPLSISSWLGV